MSIARGTASTADILGRASIQIEPGRIIPRAGILALGLSFFTTYLSGWGLRYLTAQGHGEIMPAIILGAAAAAAFFGGVPVGPLITSGMLALVVKLFHK